MKDQRRRCRTMVATAVVVAVVGCGQTSSESFSLDQYKELQRTPLRTFGALYGEFIGRHGNRPPANEEQFRKHLTTIGRQEIEKRGVADIEDLFVSPRDGQPMVVLYGKNVGPAGAGGMPWIAYERQSTAGRRYVVGAIGVVIVMEDQEFHELFPHAP